MHLTRADHMRLAFAGALADERLSRKAEFATVTRVWREGPAKRR